MICLNCSNPLPNDAKFCGKCGKPTVAQSEKIDIEKISKSLKNTGNSVYAIGWITIIFNLGIYLWSVADENFAESGLPTPDLSSTLIMVLAASIFIILGSRIKGLVDKRMSLYIQILLGLSLLLLVWVFATGGRVGILFFLIIAYLLSSAFSIRKAMGNEEFTSKLVSPQYTLDKKGWIIYGIVSVVLLIGAVFIDTSMNSSSTETETASQENVENYFADTSEWKNFVSTSGFSVTVPKYPTSETDTINIPNSDVMMKIDTYTSDEPNGTTYLITVNTPLGVTSDVPLTNFDGPLNGMLASDPSNKLIASAKATTEEGRPALNYLIENGAGGYLMKGKLILDGTVMYNLMVAYESQNYNDSNINKFINSFTLQ